MIRTTPYNGHFGLTPQQRPVFSATGNVHRAVSPIQFGEYSSSISDTMTLHSDSLETRLNKAAAFIQKAYPHPLSAVLILGSSGGPFGDALKKEHPEAVVIPYSEIPGFDGGNVKGHAKELILFEQHGKHMAVMSGRNHFYEGHPIQDLPFPIRTLHQLGAKTLIVTNAAGGIRNDHNKLAVGDLMLITDHLNLLGDNPLKGPNPDFLGPRFPDMSEAYSKSLRELAKDVGKDLDIPLKEGVYLATSGPCYETPAEIRMMATLGADAVGMSTVPEVIAANHMGMKVLGISTITNLAAGLGDSKLDHSEVTTVGKDVGPTLNRFLTELLKRLG